MYRRLQSFTLHVLYTHIHLHVYMYIQILLVFAYTQFKCAQEKGHMGGGGLEQEREGVGRGRLGTKDMEPL